MCASGNSVAGAQALEEARKSNTLQRTCGGKLRWRLGRSLGAALLLALVLPSRPAATFAARQKAEKSLREQAQAVLARIAGRMEVAELEKPVEILRDPWGVAHFYAQTQQDLFFAQGFVAAQDRLWQLEMWRRKAEGQLAEVLGPAGVERDRYARLLRYRGDMEAEWRSYSPDTRTIVEAFVRGINAYIAQLGDRLPVEFQLLHIRPQPWTPEVCLSRMAAYPMTGAAARDLLRAELVQRLGAQRAAQVLPPDPPRALQPGPGLSLDGIGAHILEGLGKASREVDFAGMAGSNNWALSGARTQTGKPILANDPHRTLAVPSLRYIVHLVGPGWDVIGAGEPALPGISIGHNQRIAFGLTIFPADQQDIYVERTHPHDANLYFDPSAREHWRKMEVVEEGIRVRGEAQARRVELKFTRHGPVVYEDHSRQRAFALRWVGTEPGTAGYLAGLAISRAQNWAEFRGALERWKLPPENFVYADVDGNIGYQAAGLVPIRGDGDGMLPVPGDTEQYDWTGFRKLDELPHEFNPARGYVATANNNTLPANDARAISFDWAAPYRIERIREVLQRSRAHTVQDSERLQADIASLPARELLALLGSIPAGDERRTRALALVRAWDGRVEKDSAAAALVEVWLEQLREAVFHPLLPGELWLHARRSLALPTLLGALRDADRQFFGAQAEASRNQALASSLDQAIAELEKRLGREMSRWRWGALHVAQFEHPLGHSPEGAAVLNHGPIERSGDGNTVNATGGPDFVQNSGASYREVFDLADWDRSAAINVPGQSGQAESPHYADLLALWSREEYFPLLYSHSEIAKRARDRLVLVPTRTGNARFDLRFLRVLMGAHGPQTNLHQ